MKNKKLLLSLFISAIAIGFLLFKFDLNEFAKVQERWNPLFLIPVLIWNILAMIPFSLRWYYLLDRKLEIKKSMLSAFLGVGANMVLPARGGDILRLYYCKNNSDIHYATLVSQLFIEKVLDLIIVLLIGAGSFLLLGLGDGNSSPTGIFISGLVVLGVLFLLVLIRFANSFLIRMGRMVFSWIGKEEIFIKSLEPHLEALKNFLTLRKLLIPVAITVPTWLAGYAVTYMFESYLIGIPLEYTSILFIVFCGAMGVAVPSAPSGLGVFHASIVSGFVLLGLRSEDGFVFATAVHLLQFIILSLLGYLAYLIWMVEKKGESKEKNRS
ncbi:MAG: flippase-like domain-containing protein [Leptospiraceae bacterium]|nr:flippase-like domain-containing protein [Leptospiraceae bacterium]